MEQKDDRSDDERTVYSHYIIVLLTFINLGIIDCVFYTQLCVLHSLHHLPYLAITIGHYY